MSAFTERKLPNGRKLRVHYSTYESTLMPETVTRSIHPKKTSFADAVRRQAQMLGTAENRDPHHVTNEAVSPLEDATNSSEFGGVLPSGYLPGVHG